MHTQIALTTIRLIENMPKQNPRVAAPDASATGFEVPLVHERPPLVGAFRDAESSFRK